MIEIYIGKMGSDIQLLGCKKCDLTKDIDECLGS
jgi:hypothetical protein